MPQVIRGTVHGSHVELERDPGLTEGQQVEVVLRPLKDRRPWGEGIRRSAGALAESWTEDDDRILRELYEDRKRPTRREVAP